MFVTRSRIVANRARASIKKRHSDSESVRTNQKHAMRECLESSGVIRTRASTAFRKSNRAPFFREIRSFLERGGGRKKKLSAFLRYRATMRTRNAPVYPHVCNIFVTIFKHNTSSSTTSTRRFGIAGVDRPLIGFSRLNAKIYDETFIKIIIIIISSLPPHRDLSHLTTTSKSISLFSKKKKKKEERNTNTKESSTTKTMCVCVFQCNYICSKCTRRRGCSKYIVAFASPNVQGRFRRRWRGFVVVVVFVSFLASSSSSLRRG